MTPLKSQSPVKQEGEKLSGSEAQGMHGNKAGMSGGTSEKADGLTAKVCLIFCSKSTPKRS